MPLAPPPHSWKESEPPGLAALVWSSLGQKRASPKQPGWLPPLPQVLLLYPMPSPLKTLLNTVTWCPSPCTPAFAVDELHAKAGVSTGPVAQSILLLITLQSFTWCWLHMPPLGMQFERQLLNAPLLLGNVYLWSMQAADTSILSWL